MQNSVPSYHTLLIIIHWVMALCIMGMLAAGLLMTSGVLEKSLTFQLYQWHKSLGIILLWLVCARIVLRLSTKKPVLPISLRPWERIAANAGHIALYGIMVIMPLTGWMLVSSSPYGLPTIVFGWFEWPHVPNIAENHAIHELAKELHEYMASVAIAVIALHIGAVVKHAVIDKENLLPRMGIGKHTED